MGARVRSGLFAFVAAAGALCAQAQQTTVFTRIYVTPGREAEAVERLRSLVAYVHEHEPDVKYEYYRLRTDPTVIIGYEVFPNDEVKRRHLSEVVPAVSKLLGKRPEGLYSKPPVSTIGDPLS
jgi:quinol monooxygenase YgiN